jgi:EAL and modified HD-GYP domain-containing signal transduction protein
MVGRQPVFDGKLDVRGYGLQFRELECPPQSGGGVAELAGLGTDLRSMVGDKLAFLEATRAFVVGERESPFLVPGRTVIEVPRGLPRDREIVGGYRRLVQEGFALAVKGVAWDSDDEDPVLELASVIKLDTLAIEPARLAEAVMRASAFGVELVAENVDAPDQFKTCGALGFDLFQGGLLSRPEVAEGEPLSPGRLTCLQVLRELCDPDMSARKVERTVQTDAALSYRFLRLASEGAARGMFRPVNSVREAVVLLGERRLRSWVSLMMVAGTQDGSNERLTIAMTRAQMCELMALELAPRLADSAFTVGLVSALDVLLQVSLPTVLGRMSLAPALEDALLHHAGVLGNILSDVLIWEAGGYGIGLQSGLCLADAARCYMQAVAWATEVCAVFEMSA